MMTTPLSAINTVSFSPQDFISFHMQTLKAARLQQKYTQIDIESVIGVSRKLVSRFETGHEFPSLSTFVTLACGLGFALHVVPAGTLAPPPRRRSWRVEDGRARLRLLVDRMIRSLMSGLKRRRKQQGLTQEKLSNLLHIPQKTISLLENGLHRPRLTTFFRLVQALGCELVLVRQPCAT